MSKERQGNLNRKNHLVHLFLLQKYLLTSPNSFCHHSFNSPSTSLSLFSTFCLPLHSTSLCSQFHCLSVLSLSFSKSTCHHSSLLTSTYICFFLPCPSHSTSRSHSFVFLSYSCLFISSHQLTHSFSVRSL